MEIVFLGDIVGRSGREAVLAYLFDLRKNPPDFIIVNGENAAGGFGITPKICEEFFKAGVDVITTGNHVWDQQEILSTLARDKRVLRPQNYPENTTGSGSCLISNAKGQKLLVAHVQGQLFMHEALNCPFAAADSLLKEYKLAGNVNAIFFDIHAEATSEKSALANYLDGRISGIVGTHTHVPTADARILPGGTAYQSDAGMCGDYDSVIGMEKSAPIRRFVTKVSKGNKMTAAEGEATVCGTWISIDDKTGLATAIKPIRAGKQVFA